MDMACAYHESSAAENHTSFAAYIHHDLRTWTFKDVQETGREANALCD